MRELLFKLPLFLLLFYACDASVSLGPDDSNNSDGPRGRLNSPGEKLNDFEKEIFELVNAHRVKLGKSQLMWHDQAIIESQDHSQDMAAFKVPFGHAGSNLRFERIKAKDPDPILKLGENVAKNSTAKKAFEAWLLSLGHRQNIEGNYTHTGIGAVKSANGSWYFTQIFLKK